MTRYDDAAAGFTPTEVRDLADRQARDEHYAERERCLTSLVLYGLADGMDREREGR